MNSPTTDGRLAGRIAVITGASRGLGAAVAKRFAAEGAHLVLVARTTGALESVDDAVRAAGGQPATLVPADLSKHEALEVLGASLYERFGRIDILVGNAAMLGSLSPIAHSEVKPWRQTLELNLVTNYRLIRAMDPLLRQSDAGRAIFVTDHAAASGTKAFWNAYAVSKAGLEALVKLYAAENAKSAIRANLIDPGPLATALRAKAFPGENRAALPTPDSVTDLFVDLAEPGWTGTGEILGAPRDQD